MVGNVHSWHCIINYKNLEIVAAILIAWDTHLSLVVSSCEESIFVVLIAQIRVFLINFITWFTHCDILWIIYLPFFLVNSNSTTLTLIGYYQDLISCSVNDHLHPLTTDLNSYNLRIAI